MHRVDADGHLNNTFTDGNDQTGVEPTTLGAKWHNSVQEEIANVVEAVGDTLDAADNTQLITNLIPHVAGITALRALTPVNGRRYYLDYHTTAGDGGHGVFRGITGASAATYTHNNYTVVVPSGGDGSSAWVRENPVQSATSKTASFSVAATDGGNVFLCDATSGVITVSLVSAATVGTDFKVKFIKKDSSANAVTLDGASSETIDSTATYTLRVKGSSVTITSDGTNWRVDEHGPTDIPDGRDVLLGANAGWTGPAMNNNLARPIDFWWDDDKRRLHLRTLLITENGDTPEVALRRCEGTYPDGTSITGLTDDTTIALVHATGSVASDGSFQSRSGQIVFKASEAITASAAGGRVVISTTPIGTAAGSTEALIVESDQKVLVGQSHGEGVGRLNALSTSATEGVLYLKQSSASYTGYVLRMDATTDGAGAPFDFLRCYANNANDLEFRFTSAGDGTCDGSWTGGGADYAEFFESVDGVEIPIGTVVVLEGEKIRPRNEKDSDDSVLGVVRPKSGASSVIGDAAPFQWSRKYVRDAHGDFVMEPCKYVQWVDVEIVKNRKGEAVERKEKAHSYEVDKLPPGIEVPPHATYSDGRRKILSAEYSADADYIPRADRPEWHVIGLLGKVTILTGQRIPKRWKKMKSVTDAVDLFFIR